MTVKDVQAFLLLRQSALSVEDKKKVLTMVNGPLTLKEVEKAMRALSTKILVGTAEKKKIYPANYVEPENQENETTPSSAFVTSSWTEDEECDQETINYLANMGDNDASTIMEFERDLEEAMQEIPDLQQAMVTYLEARQRKKKSRQFWPSHGGKPSSKGFGKRKGKGGGKASLLDRIARSYCKVCGKKGHWKAECPDREKEQVNTAVSFEIDEDQHDMPINHVIVEEYENEALGSVSESPDSFTDIVNRSFSDSNISTEVACVAFQITKSDKMNCEKAKWMSTKNLAKLKEFYVNKLSQKSIKGDKSMKPEIKTAPPKHRSNQNPVSKELIAPVCMMSSDGIKKGSTSTLTPGMAILDTGASRSVVGEDHVPWIMKQLPEQIRSMVKERDSRVGFRFGNNQIEYSFKQMQIPLIQGNQRVWILIEVVPKATPFLISIHTMKCLRAVIDLESGSCFLKSIGKSIPIIENKNGLMTLKIQDLCRIHHNTTDQHQETYETCAAAISEFKSKHQVSSAFDSLTNHANTRRDNAAGQGRSRGSHGEPPSPPPGLDEPDRSSRPIPRSANGISSTGELFGLRGAESEGSNRATDDNGSGSTALASSTKSASDTSPESQQSSESKGANLRCDVGIGMGCHRGRRVFGRSLQPSKVSSSSISSKPFGGWSKPSSTRSQCAKDTDNDTGRWTPIGQYPSRPTTGSDTHDNGKLGKQENQLGQEASPESLLPSVRGRSTISSLATTSSEPECSNERFSGILPSSGESRSPGRQSCSSPKLKQQCPSLCQKVYSQVLTIDTVEEANWITFSEGNHKTPEKFPEFVGPIDLLEVYASENSRLTEQINSMGGKAMRFTKEHGDLGTPAGQRALLEVIDRTQPRHIWVAPECGPWCAWSRFNMGRSLNSHQEISQKRIESLKHLRLCTAILKIQILKGRHFHMENPEGSEVWGLKEVQDIVKHTIPVRFDQCQYGLRHPNNSTYLKKGTRIQTTSEEVQAHMNGRFCQGQHPHSQIAGSCVYQGKTIRVSRFSAFYPVVLAKTLSKSLLSEQGPPSLQTMCVQEEAFPADIEPNIEPGEHPEAPKPKRLRVEGKDRKVDRPSESHHGAEKGPLYDISNRAWETVFSRLQTVLPKSGTRTWSNDQDRLIRDCQALHVS